MKRSSALFLFPLIAFSACDPGRDAANRDTPDEADQDRPPLVADPNPDRTPAPAGGGRLQAVAEIMPTQGNEARGAIRLSGSDNGSVQIAGTITGLKPGAHGFHVHEFGDCSAPDAASAGDHFNPHDDPHGSPRDLENAHHVGDLGNITANEEGEAEIDLQDNEMKLSGPESVIGRALVVHSDQDDFETQPSGNSGSRVGCGEIVETTQAASQE
jgi:Cu-Zn family superoxide dismutase